MDEALEADTDLATSITWGEEKKEFILWATTR